MSNIKVHRLPGGVEYWYDPHVRSWCVRRVNPEGDQVGDSMYVYNRSEAIIEASALIPIDLKHKPTLPAREGGPRRTQGQQWAQASVAHRGGTCELCGRPARPRPRCGKARYPHKCPHGLPCARGDKLLGIHQNHPTCPQCAAAGYPKEST